MFEKIVQQNKRITTINSEEIVRVVFSESYSNYFVRNDGEEFAYASDSEFTDFDLLEDGVVSIPKNGIACVFGSLISTDKDIYVKGNVTIAATNSDSCPFKFAKDGEDKAVLGSIPEVVNNGAVIAKDYQLDGITDFVVNVPDRCEIAGIGTVTQNGMIKAADFELDGISELDVQVPDPHTFSEKVISENGVYNSSDDNISGFSKVTVDVPDPHTFSEKVISENGVYNSSDDNISGFSKVTVDVPDPHIFGTKTITKNGTYNSSDSGVSGFSSVSVNIPLNSKTITSNGLYVNPEGGWKNVQVDVPDPHKFGNLTATANKTYYASDSGLSGFSNVSVQVPDPHSFGSKRITSNGTYNSEDDGVSGYSNVSVEIPLGTKTITENGVYNSVDSGVSGFSSVEVNVPDPHTFGNKIITSNGTYNSSDDNVSGYSNVSVEIPLGTKTITENGVYNSVDSGFSGFSSVDVNVPDNHTFGNKIITSNGTYNSSDDNISGFSSVSVNVPEKINNGRIYIYDSCMNLKVDQIGYIYTGTSQYMHSLYYNKGDLMPNGLILEYNSRSKIRISGFSELSNYFNSVYCLGLSICSQEIDVPAYFTCYDESGNVVYSEIQIDLNGYRKKYTNYRMCPDIVIPLNVLYGYSWACNFSSSIYTIEITNKNSVFSISRIWLDQNESMVSKNP